MTTVFTVIGILGYLMLGCCLCYLLLSSNSSLPKITSIDVLMLIFFWPLIMAVGVIAGVIKYFKGDN